MINGATASSAIDSINDEDWFRVTLDAGESYAFSLNSSSGAPLSDPFLRLYDQNGHLVSIDDDGGAGLNALMRFTATNSGTYYLSAGGIDNGTGGYVIGAATGPAQDPLDTIDLDLTFNTNTISIYFATAGQTLGPSGRALRSWTASEKAAVMSALGTIADVTNLTFTTTTSAANADFVLTLADLPPGILGSTIPGESIGYLRFATDGQGWDSAGLQPGGLGYATILHEVCHALGLAHPHWDGGDIQVMQGVTSEFDDYGSFYLNQQVFTVMSYNDGWPDGVGYPYPTGGTGHAATPMALDIALLQQRYGADINRNAGDTQYVLDDFGEQTAWKAIWDTGGTDTITYEGNHDVTIDLRAATLLSQIGGGGFVSYVHDQNGGFTIAANVLIENATGDGGDDTLIGNALNNVLIGNVGSDTLDGGAGDDIMVGGHGADTYVIDSLTDVIDEAPSEVYTGYDTVRSWVSGYVLGDTLEHLTLLGTAVEGRGNELSNNLSGNDADNILYGFGSSDTIDGGAGADQMHGGAGNDYYRVDNSLDQIFEDASADFDVVHSSANYTLAENLEQLWLTVTTAIVGVGNSQNNSIYGNTANNMLYGMDGDDALHDGGGVDQMFGGLGNDFYDIAYDDIVVEAADEGIDTVRFYGPSYTLPDNVENLQGGVYDELIGNELDNSIRSGGRLYGLGGNDVLDASDYGDGQMFGGAGDDIYVISWSGDSAIENADEGIDTVHALESYTLASNIENLTITGDGHFNGVGNQLDNTLTGNMRNNVLSGLAGDDEVRGEAGTDVLDGGDGADALFGGAGVDALYGRADADVLDGGEGDDQMFGGEGDDIYYVDSGADQTFEGSATWGTDLVFASVSYFLGANIDNLTLTGSNAINGSGNVLANVITGNGAINQLYGNAGNDTLDGGAGADGMYGGEGDDIYYVDNAVDQAFEAQAIWGTDLVYASVDYQIIGNIDNLTLTGAAVVGRGNFNDNVLTGNALNNTLFGMAGNDTLNGGVGADQMYGREGDDTYYIDNVGDVAFEADANWGVDTVYSSVTLTLTPGLEHLNLTGASAINGSGNALNNTIQGNGAANTLFGYGGNDVLNGNQGADQMYGGEGDDTYYVDHVSDVAFEVSAAWGADTVLASVSFALGSGMDNLVLIGDGDLAGAGNALANTITGNSGANTLIGGAGDDTFVFGPDSGADTITDFVAGGGEDSLDLSAYDSSGVTWQITQVGADTLFTFSNGDSITLANVDNTQLVQDDAFHYS